MNDIQIDFTASGSSMKWMKVLRWLILLAGLCGPWLRLSAAEISNPLEIQAVTVDSKGTRIREGRVVDLGAFPGNIAFSFKTSTNFDKAPGMIRYKLDGYDPGWRADGGEMNVTVRFYNDADDQISQKTFTVSGQSPGWTGSLKTSQLSHRRETLVVPPLATRVWVVISSAGPPATVGIYVVANLTVTKTAGGLPPVLIMQSPSEHQLEGPAAQTLAGWTKDGTGPSMAKIVKFGQDPETRAFAILDDSPISHAEWRTLRESAPKVNPGERLVVEWNEMYCMGVTDVRVVRYQNLPVGAYQLHIRCFNIMGVPAGSEINLKVLVPQPFWRKLWFWGLALFASTAVMMLGGRYVIRRKMEAEMLRLKNEQALERERLRIAHDIHDDLGARVTQISLLSAMSQDNPNFPAKARADFDQISRMSRELVSALYETVWAVNPENDNLDALGNYLCQMVNQLCERTGFRCRFQVHDLPREIEVSSQIRHNISMAVKEAVHNVIRHAKATEVTVGMVFEGGVLGITVLDNGCGFQPEGEFSGNGLTNMRRRLGDIGGSCVIESHPGQGTTVGMRLVLRAGGKNA